MKLSISNIAWSEEKDMSVLNMMKSMGFEGLEIAPTRIFPNNPYEKTKEAAKWVKEIENKYGVRISSMQSIWYGRNEKLFGTEEERTILLDYTKKAIEFAEIIGCGNLVFGCPRNRNILEDSNIEVSIDFFNTIGEYALKHNTVVGIEANPPIYNTNFINTTESAFDLIKKVDSEGFKLNLDIGTMIQNKEDISILNGREQFINHIHISEPSLSIIERRPIHKVLYELLECYGYNGFVSIEVGRQDNLDVIEKMMKYVKSIFGEK